VPSALLQQPQPASADLALEQVLIGEGHASVYLFIALSFKYELAGK
jgi:hypothetical protein